MFAWAKRLGWRWVLGLMPLAGILQAESCRIEVPGQDINIDFDNNDDFFDDLDEFFDDLGD